MPVRGIISDRVYPSAGSWICRQLTGGCLYPVLAFLLLALLPGLCGAETLVERVKDINTVATGTTSVYGEIVEYNGAAYFLGYDGPTGAELWKSDGTTAGTVLVKDINPGIGSSSVHDFTIANGLLFFRADDGTHGSELWKTDGTAAGTSLVADLEPGSGSSFPVISS